MKYYYMMPKRYKEVASAYPIHDIKPAHELIKDLEGQTQMPTRFELVKLTETRTGLVKGKICGSLKNIWLDFLPNSLSWPFYSVAIKNIIDKYVVDSELLRWIECNVISDFEERVYYIPMFIKKIDILDYDLTQYIPDTDYITVPVISLEKVNNKAIFPRPLSGEFWKIQSTVYMSQDIVKDIKKAKLEGMTFTEILCK